MHETTVPADDGRIVPVADLPFPVLQRLFKQHHGPAIPDVPDINAVLDLVDHRTELCFEVKMGSYDLGLFARLLTDALGFYGPRGDVVISSFSPDILEFLRPYLRPFGVKFAFIFNSIDVLDSVPVDIRSRFDLLHPWYRLLIDNPGAFFPGGPPIRCWTINDRKTMQALIGRTSWLPVEAIMTDDISLAEQDTEI
jgi:glycerophosphoryl diester phosphodiesterase